MRGRCFSYQLSIAAAFALAILSVAPAAKAVQSNAVLSVPIALHTRVTINLDDVPLHVAIESLAQQVNVRVEWDEAALVEIGLPSDETVALQIDQKVQFHNALNLILEPLLLAYEDQGDSILITSDHKWKQRVVKTTYVVDDVVTDQVPLETLPATMAKLLSKDLDVGVWQQKDSNLPGYMAIVNGALEITHRREVQQEVSWSLDLLRFDKNKNAIK